MWLNSKISQILKIKIPLIQAPMAGTITSAELIANVSNAGGLGSLGAGYMNPQDIRKTILQIRTLTDKPFAINLFIPNKPHVSTKQITAMTRVLKKTCASFIKDIQFNYSSFMHSFEEQLQVIIEEKIPIFSFTFGVPSDKWIKQLKHHKVKLIGTATTVAEAKILQQKGIDIIVAQGYEAGGHRGTFLGKCEDALIGNFALLPQIADEVTIPVIAAGGIMDARGIVAALFLGASGVQLGTAFITCPEAIAHQKYKQALLQAKDNSTTLTKVFSGKMARGLKNDFIKQMEKHADLILDYPVQHLLTKQIRDSAAKQDKIDYMSLWAGQAAALCQILPAGKLVKTLDQQVEKILKQGIKR